MSPAEQTEVREPFGPKEHAQDADNCSFPRRKVRRRRIRRKRAEAFSERKHPPRGVRPSRSAIAAAVPSACPISAQVAITRVEERAVCVALILRPANIRFSMFFESRQRYGIPYGDGAGCQIVGGSVVRKPAG